jgi:hypothetical protein
VRELVLALEFRGRGEDVPGAPGQRRARTSARMDAGETATLEARVQRFGDGTFVEEGRIAYGAGGAVTFTTLGRGWMTGGPAPGAVHGAVIWTVTGGEGRFAGASGVITSNFAVSASGEVVDHHVARLHLPD